MVRPKKLNLIQALKLNDRIESHHHIKAVGTHLLEPAGAWEAVIAR